MKFIKILPLWLSLFSFCGGSFVRASDGHPKIKISLSERARLTAFDNSISLSDDSESWVFSRHKTSLGIDCKMSADLDIAVKVTNENRIWLSPGNRENKFSEIFFDKLFLKWRGVGGIPLDLKIGRQYIMFDEGFVCFDGQPLTGSKSLYFNAIRGDYSLGKGHCIAAFCSYVPNSDNLLPVFNEGGVPQLLEEQGNTGLGLYYRGELKRNKLSLYYFRKVTEKNVYYTTQSRINVFGARLETPLSERFSATAEGAIQSGEYGEVERVALGGYAYLDYKLINKSPLNVIASLGGFYLSGDDPSTDKIEGWDPLWSRWPKWSESFIYTLIPENNGKVGYWSNISSLYAMLKGDLSSNISFQTAFHHLLALEDNRSDFCSGDGRNRGDLFTLRINYKINKNWSGHFVAESFNPGNFYFSDADGYNWFRFELLVSI